MARPVLFCCPVTGATVEGHFESEAPDDGLLHYEAMPCPACAKVHLVNVATGKLMSEDARA